MNLDLRHARVQTKGGTAYRGRALCRLKGLNPADTSRGGLPRAGVEPDLFVRERAGAARIPGIIMGVAIDYSAPLTSARKSTNRALGCDRFECSASRNAWSRRIQLSYGALRMSAGDGSSVPCLNQDTMSFTTVAFSTPVRR